MSTDNIAEIQAALTEEKLVIGTDTVVKGLKNGEVAKVFVTSNAPEIVKSDLYHYAKLSEAEVVELAESNEELRDLCKKRFLISVVARSKWIKHLTQSH